MMGDEIMVVSTEGIHDFGSPELYKPYVVVGIKYGHASISYNKPFYQIEPLGMTDEDRTGAMLAGGGRMKPMYIFSPEDGHGGSDQWILRPGFLRGELNEHDQPGLSPELTYGDTILVVDIDRERENSKTTYNTPGEEMRPEKYVPYTVVDKESNGHQSKWPFRYTLVPEGQVDEYEESLDRGYGNYEGYEKLLYPWIYEWIYADAPTANKVDRLTLSEHEQTKINPELEIDDIITLIEVEDGFLGEKRPEIFDVYRVVGKGGGGDDGVRQRYNLIKLKGEQRSWSQNRTYTIYNGDTWIYADAPPENKVDRLTISEHNQPELSPDLEVGDVIRVIDVDGEHARMPERFGTYKVQDAKQDNATQEFYYDIVPYPSPHPWNEYGRTLYRGDTWIYADVDRKTISEHKEEFNQRLTMGDIIRVVDVDKESTYEQPTYGYDTGNASGNSLRTNHRREQVHGEDTYPRPMKLYMVTSKSTYRPKDRDYLNPYWMIWPVDKDGKIEDRKDLHQPILTEKDTWMTVKKHNSNIPGDIEAQQKEYDDSGRNIISRRLGEQIDTQGGEIIRGDDEFSDEELEKRRTYDDFSDEEKREIDNEHIDMTPFTSMEVKILKTLHKHLTRSDLQKLSNETPARYGEPGVKFWDIMKLFGINSSNEEKDTRNSKYAKWALDNWTKEGDYGNIEDPIKVPLKWYQIDREETGSQVEYKVGSTEVLGFDEDDASERGDYNFWDWGGEMETNDYGDYESYDSEITNSEFLRMDEGLGRVLRENTRVSDNFDDPLFLSMDKQKIQDLLFNYWIKHGPTLDSDKLKLLGFDMKSYDERGVVWDNLQEYYGDQELTEIIHERLEGLHDSWNYEYIVTSWSMDSTGDIDVNVLVNGDAMMPISQESGEVIDMSLWDINKSSAEDGYQYDDAYEEVRSTISDDISNVLLKDLPVDMNLDYLDMSEPGTFEVYVKENEVEMITEDDDGYIDDMVYIDEPREKHIRRMGRGLGSLVGFPLDKYKNMPPPENESDTTEDEIEYLEGIPVDKNLVDSADEIRKHFQRFLSPKGLEYPKQEMKEAMQGVKAIILILKYYYNRPRPWQIAQAKGLELNSETLQSSSSPSYPSGHATQGRFVARYLSDLYPEYIKELMQIGDDIAFSRNMAKVHYPSDSAFGKMVGDDMYDFISNNTINEQVVVDKGDRLKSDIFRILSNTFILTPTDYSEIKDNDDNYYDIYDTKQDQHVNMSELIQGVIEFVAYGVESGDFKEQDIQKAITAITDWVSLMMNQEKEYLN